LCYLHLGKFDNAEGLFKSTNLQEAEKDTLALIGSYMNIATLYYDQYKDDQAPVFCEILSIIKTIDDFRAALNMAVVRIERVFHLR
jgi:hypothetical protein